MALAGSPKGKGKKLSASASAPALPAAAAPGGPWVLRNVGGKIAGPTPVPQPPELESAAVAWKASRKQTLHGQLGTGNKISSVVQYPISTADPWNMAQMRRRHLSAEDRRILRVRVKHGMRHAPSYPDCVYEVEKLLIKNFCESPELCDAFYSNDTFAAKTVEQAGITLQGVCLKPPRETYEHKFCPPGHHGAFCSPKCFCLKYQDAPLNLQGDGRNDDGIWESSFAEKTKLASDKFHRHTAALPLSTAAAATRLARPRSGGGPR